VHAHASEPQPEDIIIMPNLHISYAFAALPQEQIDNFTKGVSDNLYTEPAYAASVGPPPLPGPPVTKTELDDSNTSLTTAIAKSKRAVPAIQRRRM
jgi:hypothetical protein